MANLEGTSTSSTLGSEYEVFLSFRGPDTRSGFTHLLYRTLDNLGICVFMDDDDLRPGEIIGDNLLQAINNSKLYIPIFSKNYASSRWCLRELAKMVENIPKSKEEGKEKIILPIFYDVKRDDLKLETGLYCKDISNLEREMNDQKKDVSDVPKWRKALQDVCCAEGWERGQLNSDGDLIDLIVQKVEVILKTRQRRLTKDLVGMKDRIAKLHDLLDIESNVVRVIGIYGMGGIGKTTLAKIIFNELCPRFGRNCSFLEDVREKANTEEGLEKLQKVLVSDICHSGVARNINDTDRGTDIIEKAIYKKKVLIVLDDVDDHSQVEKLIAQDFLYPGTRILLTARNKSILQNVGGLPYEVELYHMGGLSRKDALELFSWHAFDDSSPPEDYGNLSKAIVSTTCGLPLALKVIGSLLFREKKKEVWEERLEKLKKTSDGDVLAKLRISYDALNKEQQEIFLDIACFFVNQENTDPMYVWKDRGFSPELAIEVLTGRFMIQVSDNKFWMHSVLKDLGREIVNDIKQWHPGMRTRLWARDDIIRALKSTETKGKVQALRLARYLGEDPVTVTSEQIGRFPHLQYLWLHEVSCEGKFTGCLSELKWIDLQYGYSIPPPPHGGLQWFEAPDSLHLEDVVVMKLYGLDLTKDVLERLITEARKLKVLTLSYNSLIHGTVTFKENSSLEKLAITDFVSLTEIDGSIEKLEALIELSFERCVQLQKLPRRIGKLQKLQHLSLKNCELNELPNSVLKLKSLTKLDVSSTRITRLPDNIGQLSSLSSVDASYTSIEKVPGTMSELPELQTLRLDHCDRIQELPKLPRCLTTLRLSSDSLLIVPNLSDLPHLVELALSDGSQSMAKSEIIQTCNMQWIGSLSKLEKLYFCFSNAYAPTTELASLSRLKELTLHGVDVPAFKQLPSNLEVLELYDTRGKKLRLNKLPPSEKETEFVSSSSMETREEKVLRQIELRFFQERDSSEETVCLREEPGCVELQAPELIGHWRGDSLSPSPLGMLQKFVLWGCPEVQEIHFDSTPKYLFVVSVAGCTSLRRLGGLSKLEFLMELTINQCPSLQVVEGINELKFLQKLKIHGCRSMPRIFDGLKSEIPYKCEISISCSGELPDSRPANGIVNWRSYINAPDPEVETTDSETETEDPSRNTNQENEEKERESATEGPLRISAMMCFPENFMRDDRQEDDKQRKRSWSYYS